MTKEEREEARKEKCKKKYITLWTRYSKLQVNYWKLRDKISKVLEQYDECFTEAYDRYGDEVFEWLWKEERRDERHI